MRVEAWRDEPTPTHTDASQATGIGIPRERAAAWQLAALALCALLPALGISIANVALPTFASAFDAPFGDVRWVVLAYLLASTTALVGAGRLGDIVGRRRLLLAGIALFAVASLGCGAATTLGWLVAARAAQGVGAAIMMALGLALVGDAMPKARTGRAMGVLGTMSAVGTALGPSLGGATIALAGWRAIFLVNVPIAVLAFVLARAVLPEAERNASRTRPPLLDLRMLRDPTLRTGLAASLLVATVLMATLVVGPFYLSHALGLAPAAIGMAMSAGPAVAALSGMPAGRLADRFGPARMTCVALGGIVAGLVLLASIPVAAGVAGYVASIVVVTAHYALFQAANNAAVMNAATAGSRGAVSGMLNLSRNLGFIGGTAAMGAVFAFASSAAGDPATSAAATAFGFRTTFLVAAVLVVVALVLALRRRSGDA
jgi:MFS family permease